MANAVGEGVSEKFRRADMHREDFNERVQRFIEGDPYRVIRYDELDTGRRVWEIEVRKQPPLSEWAGLIGDCLFNFRSALDHLAYDLAIAYSGAPLPPDVERNSAFPIFYERAPTPQELERRIGAIDPKARRIIETMQPYGRTDRTVLGYLETLHNFDKHRTLHVVAGFPAGVSHYGDTPFDDVDFRPFVDGQVIASGPIPDDPEVDNDPSFHVGVAFSEEGPCKGYEVRLVLAWLSQHIENGVFPLLLPYL